jgi:hypothetical protein
VLIPGGESGDQPQGPGYGFVTVTTSGVVIFSGRLSDGTVISRVTDLASDGSWPFFASIISGFEIALGQIVLEDVPGTSDMDGEITWVRRQSASPTYPNGFSVQSSLVGSSFTPAARGNNVLNLDLNPDNTSIAIGGGDLSGEMDFTGTLDGLNRFVGDDTATQLRYHMGLSNGNGMMTGNFIDPASGRLVAFTGVVLQKQNIAAGFWLGSSLSGYTMLQGK